MEQDDFLQIDQAISDALAKFGNARMKKAMREIAQYLRRKNRFRIRAQQNVDGSAYTPRKSTRRKKGKMMKGFAKRMQAKWTTENAVISINGKLAPIHHEGQEERGIQYPSRTLIGLPEKDKQAVLDILLKNLELNKI
jgi:phage virion morphogenesis protein